ncbi:MAG: PAS domain S-box protein [Anaerolineae bacterium]|nr:PAS domain S-box protein [Anaerolineae bacterium]
MAYTMDTTVGDILEDTGAVKVLEKHIPGISKNPMIGMAKGFTLKQILAMPQAKDAGLTEDMVKKVLPVDFVTKPFNPFFLTTKVRIFLDLDKKRYELLEKIELEKSKNYLESVLSSINDSLIVIDMDSAITNVNTSAIQILGYSETELKSMKINRLFDFDFFAGWKNHLVEDGNPFFPKTEMEIVKKGGEKLPVVISGSPLFENGNKLKGFVLVAFDISERKLYEGAILAAKLKAEEISKIKSSFLANMSHEIRTPLTGIVGYAELLKQERLSDYQQSLIDKIYSSGKRLGNTLNSILDLSKIENSIQKLELKKCNLKLLAERVFNSNRYSFR